MKTDRPLTFAYSPCPNDTYIFSAWTEGFLQEAPPIETRFEDIETLNRLAMEEACDLLKVSFHAYGYLRERYALLRSGGALGRNCGPLVVAKSSIDIDNNPSLKIAIPGEKTTAALLLKLRFPEHRNLQVMPFHEIMEAVSSGKADCGLIIHESRFTYGQHGLVSLVDLGAWWESEFGHPIPLGGIVVRRSLGKETALEIEQAIARSLRFARQKEEQIWPAIKRHAQEMDENVMRSHIDLYVNAFSEDYGETGETAIRFLLEKAEGLGVIPPSDKPIFAGEYSE